MIEPSTKQLEPLAKQLFVAQKRNVLVAIEQMAPHATISLWLGDKSYLWCEITTDGKVEVTR